MSPHCDLVTLLLSLSSNLEELIVATSHPLSARTRVIYARAIEYEKISRFRTVKDKDCPLVKSTDVKIIWEDGGAAL